MNLKAWWLINERAKRKGKENNSGDYLLIISFKSESDGFTKTERVEKQTLTNSNNDKKQAASLCRAQEILRGSTAH